MADKVSLKESTLKRKHCQKNTILAQLWVSLLKEYLNSQNSPTSQHQTQGSWVPSVSYRNTFAIICMDSEVSSNNVHKTEWSWTPLHAQWLLLVQWALPEARQHKALPGGSQPSNHLLSTTGSTLVGDVVLWTKPYFLLYHQILLKIQASLGRKSHGWLTSKNKWTPWFLCSLMALMVEV